MTSRADDAPVDFFGFGIAAVDELVEVERFPEPGTKVPVLGRQRQGGGLCTTALVAAARLGLRCRYAGILGHNDLSDFTRHALRQEGVYVDDDVRHPHAAPFHSTVLVDRSSGERTILSDARAVVPPTPDDVREDLIRQCRILFVDHLGPDAGEKACTVARRHGIPVVADIERIDPPVARLLSRIDHLIVPLRVARRHTGETDPEQAVRALAQSGRTCTAATDGARGCWFVDGAGHSRHQPAFDIDVVDTTGCGDVFHGAYAAAILQGLSVAEAIRYATAAAALKAAHPGAQAGAPRRADLDRFLLAPPHTILRSD